MNSTPATTKPVKLKYDELKFCAWIVASVTPATEMIAVSFWRPTKSFRSGGITRRTACGRTTWRRACPYERPSERAAIRWLPCTNPFQTSGSTCRKACGLKNASRTRCMSAPLPQDRHLREVEVEPLLLELHERAVRLQRPDRGVDRRLELAPLHHHRAVLLVRLDL